MTGQFFPLAAPSLRARRAATATAMALGLTLGLAACNDDELAPTGSSPAVSSTPSGDAEESPSASATATPTSGQAVGIYFAGESSTGLRLFREFQRVAGDSLSAAAKLVDGGDALDPDYRTLWPGQVVVDAEKTSTGIEVTLNADAFTEAPDGMEEYDAILAVQQMVHTLQGVAGERLPVHFVRADGPARLFGIDVSKPVKAAAWDDVLAYVNVTTPAQGATLSRDKELKASGVASAFEATVQWKILRGEEEVKSGFATAEGWMDKLYPWETSIDVSDLEPGDYTFVAADSDAVEGEGEGLGATEDSKEFTLR